MSETAKVTVEFGANTADLVRGLKDIAGGVGNLQNLLTGLGSAFAGLKLVSFASDAATSAAAMGKLATSLGQSTEDMSRLQYATRLSEESLLHLLGHFEQWQGKNGRGGEGLIPGLLQTADELSKLQPGAQQAQLALERFGKAGLEMVPFLQKGSDGIQDLLKRAEQFGLTSDEAAARSKKYTAAVNDLTHAQGSLKEEIGLVLIPTLQKFIEVITTVTAGVTRFIQTTPAAQSGIEALATAAATAAASLSVLKLGALAGISSMMSPLAIAVAAVGTAFAGWKIGELVGQLSILGITLKDRVEATIMSCYLAWEKLMGAFGADNAGKIAGIEEEIAALVYKLAQPVDRTAKTVSRPGGPGLTREEELKLELLRLKQEQLAIEGLQKKGLEDYQQIMVEKAELARSEYDLELKLAGDDVVKREELALELQKKLLSIQEEGSKEQKRLQEESLKDYEELLKEQQQSIRNSPRYTDKEKNALELQAMPRDEDLRRKGADDRTISKYSSRRGQLQDQDAFGSDLSGQMRLAMRQLKDEAGTMAEAIARSFKTVIGGAINSISQGIQQLIRGTITWGQFLNNVGTSIMGGIIDAIVQMAVQWVVTHVIMEAVSWAFSQMLIALGWEESSQKIAQNTAVIPSQATSAALTSVSSYGTASIIGIVMLLAMLGIGIAAACGAFAEGGRPPTGQLALVGERGPELFVPDTAGQIIPNHELNQYLGSGPPAPGSAQAAANGQPITIALHDSRSSMKDFLSTAEGEKHVVSIMARHAHRLR